MFLRDLLLLSYVSGTHGQLIGTENGIEGVAAHDHPRRNISRNERREDQEPHPEQGLVEGCNEYPVAERKIDGVRGEGGDEYRVDERKPHARADERIKNGLEHIGEFDDLAVYADAFQDADVLAARDRVDENDNEDGNRGDDEPYRGEDVAEEVEGRDDVLEELRLGVLVGLHFRVPVDAAALQRVAHACVLNPRLQFHRDLIDVAVGAADEVAHLRIHHEDGERDLVDLGLDDAFHGHLPRYTPHLHADLRADADVFERRESRRFYGDILLEEIVSENDLIVVAFDEERTFDDAVGNTREGLLILRIDADDLTDRGIRLIPLPAGLVVGFQNAALAVARA